MNARRRFALLVCILLAALAGTAFAQVDPRVPNDPLFPQQWYLMDRGSLVSFDGVNYLQSNYGIQAQKAWEYFWDSEAGNWWKLPGEGVTIAVIGGPPNLGHEELAGPRFLPTRFLTKSQSWELPPMQAIGIMAADTGNGVGMAGIAFGAKVLPIAIESGNEWGVANQIASAISYASKQGAQVILVNAQAMGDTNAVHRALRDAVQKGAVVVAPLGGPVVSDLYPSSYPEAIATADVNFLGHPSHRLPYEYVGSLPQYDAALDLVASIQSTYEDADGDGAADNITSWTLDYPTGYRTDLNMRNRPSAAEVAGVAALVFSAHPGWTGAQVRQALEDSAYWDPAWGDGSIPGSWQNAYGKGLLDAAAAVYYPNPVP